MKRSSRSVPDLTRVRLELASAHYAAGLDEKAKRHFELSLADGLPSSVENTVEGFIHTIDARKRWSLHVSGAILPETNAVRRTGQPHRPDRRRDLPPERRRERGARRRRAACRGSGVLSYYSPITFAVISPLSSAAKLYEKSRVERHLAHRRGSG